MHKMENNKKNNQQPQPSWPTYYSQPQDCSQGYCSYYCPQFCFFLFPPPPPPSPSPHLLISPILIAVISIVSAAFLLVAYYIILTAYRRRHSLISSTNLASPENHPAAVAWHPSHGASGLDDSLIEKIAACRYQSGTGLLVDGTDCSVCLSSFEDGDRIRFLPKCSHAFHVPCIDTWLKSHSNCPLCRAGVLPLSLLPPPDHPTSAADHRTSSAVAVVVQEPPNETSAAHDENVQVDLSHDIVEIDVEGRGGRLVGRSLSMDFEANSNRTNCDMMSPVRLNRSWSMRSSTSSGRRRSEVLPT